MIDKSYGFRGRGPLKNVSFYFSFWGLSVTSNPTTTDIVTSYIISGQKFFTDIGPHNSQTH